MHTSLAKDEKNKSPGLDGLTVEFYTTFWHILNKFLVDLYNERFETGKLTESQRRAVMSLIYKSGNTEQIKNYRPISLTNVHYRILAFTLAERMQNVISSIICSDQTAYIRRRYMGTNIRLVSDIIEYYDLYDKKGCLMMLDFKKAFGSVEWNYLIKVLEFFNFGSSFIQWIKTIYYEPKACIKIMAISLITLISLELSDKVALYLHCYLYYVLKY